MSRRNPAKWALLSAISLAGGAEAGGLRAGAGKAAITPSADEFPFSAPREHAFVGVHDEVYARALMLDDGQRRVALVMVEVTKVPELEELTQAIAHEINVPAANVIVAATHTHDVPLFTYHGGEPNAAERREMDRLRQGAMVAAREANSHLQPVAVAFGRGEGWVNVNNGEAIGSKRGYDPTGPSDKSLDVLRLTAPDGKPVALLVNYASHGEVMFRSVTRDGGLEVSGDLPGAVSRMLEAAPDGAPVVLYTAAAEGDQVTQFKSLQPAARLPAVDAGAAGWTLLDLQAHRLANSVLDVVAGLPPGASEGRISGASGSVTCPGQKLRMDQATGAVTSTDQPPVGIPLSLIRINEIALVGVGGDVGTEIGQHLKAAMPLAHTTLITMAGGGIGYILPDASYAHPGHGVMGSPLKPHCAEGAIIDGLMQLIRQAP